MTQLSAGIYIEARDKPYVIPPFGLTHMQSRGRDAIVEHCLWYNARGELLGMGELDATDIERITTELLEGELFALHKYDPDYIAELEQLLLDIAIAQQARTEPLPKPGIHILQNYLYYDRWCVITRGNLYINGWYMYSRELLGIRRHFPGAQRVSIPQIFALLKESLIVDC